MTLIRICDQRFQEKSKFYRLHELFYRRIINLLVHHLRYDYERCRKLIYIHQQFHVENLWFCEKYRWHETTNFWLVLSVSKMFTEEAKQYNRTICFFNTFAWRVFWAGYGVKRKVDNRNFENCLDFFPEYNNKKLHTVFYCFNTGQ